MAIWGESYSQMKTTGVGLPRTVTLGHSIIKPIWQEPNIIEQRSIINGVRSYVKVSENFASFDVIVNLKSFGAPATAGAEKLWEIMKENHTTVKFMPHVDFAQYLKTTGGAEADFYITRMIPYYYKVEPPVLHDRLLITLKSLVYIDILSDSPELPVETITDDLEDTITDDLEDTITAGI